MDATKEDKIINTYNYANDIREKNKDVMLDKLEQIKKRYTFCIMGCFIGAIIGVIWGSSGGAFAAVVYGILCAAIGGGIKNFIDRFVAVLPDCFVHTGNFVASFIIGVIKGIVYFVVCGIFALFETIKCIFEAKRDMKRIKIIMDEDDKSVRMISDYLDYSRIMDGQNKNLKELMQDGAVLHDNMYAKTVIEHDVGYAIDELNKGLRLLENNNQKIRKL